MTIIIAEAGSNHQQSFTIAKELIDAAAYSNANVVKFQLFNAESLYSDKKTALYKIFKSIELNRKWLPDLVKYSKKKNLSFCCSFFDVKSLNFLKKLNVSHIKIASSELTNLNLLSKLGNNDKNLYLSTGMADLSDVINSINFLKQINNSKITIMQCSSIYPSKHIDANINVIKLYKTVFPDDTVGYSDHTLDNVSAIAAIALGAEVFEKHFTLDKKLNGPDHKYAFEPNELKRYVQDLKNTKKSLGDHKKLFLNKERLSSRREGIFAKKNIKSGDYLRSNNILLNSPPIGIDAKFSSLISNFRIKKNIKSGTPIFWKDLEIKK